VEKEDAEAFAKQIDIEGPEGYERAAEKAGIHTDRGRVLQEGPNWAYLLWEEWVVARKDDDSGWEIRPWESENDPLYADAQAMGALEDLGEDEEALS
jgi:hypothetical protein